MFYDSKQHGSRRLHLLVLQPGESKLFKLDSASDAAFTLYAQNDAAAAALTIEGALCQPEDWPGVSASDGFFPLLADVSAGSAVIAPPGRSPVRYIRASLGADASGQAVVQVFE